MESLTYCNSCDAGDMIQCKNVTSEGLPHVHVTAACECNAVACLLPPASASLCQPIVARSHLGPSTLFKTRSPPLSAACPSTLRVVTSARARPACCSHSPLSFARRRRRAVALQSLRTEYRAPSTWARAILILKNEFHRFCWRASTIIGRCRARVLETYARSCCSSSADSVCWAAFTSLRRVSMPPCPSPPPRCMERKRWSRTSFLGA